MHEFFYKNHENFPSDFEEIHVGFPQVKKPHISAKKRGYPQKGVDNFLCEKWHKKGILYE